ncbi:MAG: fatty aldehyde-rating acyl-ACP reductase [Fimbriimonadaceae bacterium]|nr:fatty aldehyde-rating acyl-ACP reductase [Fimbriimonadaceae bacterium]
MARKYPIARFFPDSAIEAFLRFKKPLVLSRITGIESPTGAKTEGIFLACPMTPRQMMTLPLEQVYQKIVDTVKLAASEGAQLVGLGAFTAVVGDGGKTIAERSPIPVTTGNSYTVATSIEGTLKACEAVGIDVSTATLAVVGATGSIGKTCALMLGRKFGRIILIGRDLERTKAVAAEIPGAIATTSIDLIREADAIITVTSTDAEIIMPEHLKPGAVVCDVARPRDVSVRVSRERPDVLVIEGGVVKVPGDVEFNFRFGFPEGMAYACMSETMMLALEDRPVSYTLGKDVSVEQVEEMMALAKKHGFELAGFRSFEKAVDQDAIARARNARASTRPEPVRSTA